MEWVSSVSSLVIFNSLDELEAIQGRTGKVLTDTYQIDLTAEPEKPEPEAAQAHLTLVPR